MTWRIFNAHADYHPMYQFDWEKEPGWFICDILHPLTINAVVNGLRGRKNSFVPP